jgi:dTDP-glucose 4,6-dehydratase
LECAKISDVKLFVHISTDEVYGETAYDKEGAGESALLQPTNPYAASKAGAEHLVNSYFKSFKFPVILTRSNNIFGPHQYPEKVIPKFVCLLERQKPCCLHGNGETKRSFLYVTDVVEAYDTILHKGVPGDVYNIPSSNEISMKDLALQLIKLYGLDESKYIQYVRDRAFNDVRYNIDGAKVAALGWAPKVAFEDGLAKTVEYYKNIDINDIWSRADLALAAHPDIKLS